MSTTRSMTCIVCPIGCALEVVLDEQGKVVEIAGNTCKRGHDYAVTECTHPTRTLTSTVRLNGAAGEKFLPVRTDAPIPKEKLFEAIEQLNAITAEAPVKMGDVVCENFVEKGIRLIACKTVARGWHRMDASKLPRQIELGTFADVGHCQGIAIDGACMYFSFTTMLVKTDFNGHVLGSVTGLCGHLGCLAAYGGYIWGSLEYKNDAIGKEILASTGGVSNPDTFYAARFACDKITRERMDASEVMEVIKLEDVCEDYSWTYCRLSHRHGCSGIDGITFAPCTDGSDRMLIAYGIYGDEERDDNDDQVLLSFDPKAIEPYFGKLDLSDPTPGIRCLEKLFVRTGNTQYGIQNLEYDPATGYLLAAVYRGSKKHFPNYPMYFIDWRAERGEHNYLPLAEIGERDPETGIRGSRFGLGSTGMIALGEGYFYFSDAHAAKTEAGTVFSSTVSLYRMREDGSFDKI